MNEQGTELLPRPAGGAKYCPSCMGQVVENKKLAQGVHECGRCGTRFFLVITTKRKRA